MAIESTKSIGEEEGSDNKNSQSKQFSTTMESLSSNARGPEAPKSSSVGKKFPSPNKWYIAVKSPAGKCIFPSWSDCQRSMIELNDDVEIAAFPFIQSAEAFVNSSPPPGATKSMDSSASTESADTPNTSHQKKIPNVVVLSTDDEDGSPPGDSKKRKLRSEVEDQSRHQQRQDLLRRVSSLGGAARLSDMNGNCHPMLRMSNTLMDDYLESTIRSRQAVAAAAAFSNPFANLVNAASAMPSAPTGSPAPTSSLAASYLMKITEKTSMPTGSSRPSSGNNTKNNKAVFSFNWTKAEDVKLRDIVIRYKQLSSCNWAAVAEEMGGYKTAEECQQRWIRHVKPGVRKGQWTEEEDAFILRSVQSSTEQPFTRWSELAVHMAGRHGKQIRERWINHLNPNISHLPFTEEDDMKLWDAHKIMGKKWVSISTETFHCSRSENQIKNRWYSAAFKKFIAEKFGPDAYE